MASFEELTKGMTSNEILNLYRNFYFREGNNNERGIVANAINDILPKFAEYQQSEEQGLLLRLPCKLGDTVYWIDSQKWINESIVNCIYTEIGIDNIIIETLTCDINTKEFGKTVFFTREEAEQALAEMKGK